MQIMDRVNRRTWKNPFERRVYKTIAGYINDGEMAVAKLALRHGQRILDVGVGGGRTATLFAPYAMEYIGIDYTPEMVELARSNHPTLRFETMDAREMSALPDNYFDSVVFSYNGIDSVNAEGRIKILKEVARVLRTGGSFVFSTFNRDWHGFVGGNRAPPFDWTKHPLRLSYRLLMYGMGLLRKLRNQKYEVRQGEHATLLHSAHNFGILVYATTPQQLKAQLTAAGFEPDIKIFSVDGRLLNDGRQIDDEHFHVCARKRR